MLGKIASHPLQTTGARPGGIKKYGFERLASPSNEKCLVYPLEGEVTAVRIRSAVQQWNRNHPNQLKARKVDNEIRVYWLEPEEGG